MLTPPYPRWSSPSPKKVPSEFQSRYPLSQSKSPPTPTFEQLGGVPESPQPKAYRRKVDFSNVKVESDQTALKSSFQPTISAESPDENGWQKSYSPESVDVNVPHRKRALSRLLSQSRPGDTLGSHLLPWQNVAIRTAVMGTSCKLFFQDPTTCVLPPCQHILLAFAPLDGILGSLYYSPWIRRDDLQEAYALSRRISLDSIREIQGASTVLFVSRPHVRQANRFDAWLFTFDLALKAKPGVCAFVCKGDSEDSAHLSKYPSAKKGDLTQTDSQAKPSHRTAPGASHDMGCGAGAGSIPVSSKQLLRSMKTACLDSPADLLSPEDPRQLKSRAREAAEEIERQQCPSTKSSPTLLAASAQQSSLTLPAASPQQSSPMLAAASPQEFSPSASQQLPHLSKFASKMAAKGLLREVGPLGRPHGPSAQMYEKIHKFEVANSQHGSPGDSHHGKSVNQEHGLPPSVKQQTPQEVPSQKYSENLRFWKSFDKKALGEDDLQHHVGNHQQANKIATRETESVAVKQRYHGKEQPPTDSDCNPPLSMSELRKPSDAKHTPFSKIDRTSHATPVTRNGNPNSTVVRTPAKSLDSSGRRRDARGRSSASKQPASAGRTAVRPLPTPRSDEHAGGRPAASPAERTQFQRKLVEMFQSSSARNVLPTMEATSSETRGPWSATRRNIGGLKEGATARNQRNPVLSNKKETISKAQKLECLQDEFVESESKFVVSLRRVVEVYIHPLRLAQHGVVILTPNQVVDLFSNIESMLPHHERLLSNLEITRAPAKVFSENGDFLWQWLCYANNYQTAMLTLASLKGHGPWEAFLAAHSPKCDLYSALSLPLERIARYRCLFMELLKHSSSPELQVPTLRVLDKIVGIAKKVNEGRRHQDMCRRLIEIQNWIVHDKLNLVQPSRELIEEDFTMSLKGGQKIMLFICSDKLLWTAHSGRLIGSMDFKDIEAIISLQQGQGLSIRPKNAKDTLEMYTSKSGRAQKLLQILIEASAHLQPQLAHRKAATKTRRKSWPRLRAGTLRGQSL
eukprot:g80705.t1